MSPAQSVISSLSGSETAIVYDSNLAFAPIQIFDVPVAATFSVTSSDANALQPSVSHVRQFKLTLTRDFFYWPLITFTWTNRDFAFSNCVNADIGTGNGVAIPLNPAQYTCTQTTASVINTDGTTSTVGMWSILHNNPIPKSTTITYNFTVTNPQAGGTINITAQVMHRYNMNLTDIGATQSWQVTQTSSSTTTTTTSTSYAIQGGKILLSWGVDAASLSSTLQKIFTIAIGATGTRTYQAIRFSFGLNGTLPTANYTVAVTYCTTAANCDILENSISTSFSTGTCVAVLSTSNSVSCTSVTTIAASNNLLGARVWLGSGVVTSTKLTDSNFGALKISAITLDTSNNPTVSTAVANATINPQWVVIDQSTNTYWYNVNGNGPLLGYPASDSTTRTNFLALGTSFAVGAGNINLPFYGGVFAQTSAATATYNLYLFTNLVVTAANTLFSTNDATNAAFLYAGSGIDLFMNPNLWTVGSANGTGGNGCTWGNSPTIIKTATAKNVPQQTGAGKPTLTCYAFTNTSSPASWTRLRAFINNVNTLTGGSFDASGYTDLISVTGSQTYWTFAWEGYAALVNYTGASLKADNNVADYYAALYTINGVLVGTTAATQAVNQPSTDYGELGTGNMVNSGAGLIGTPMFFSAPLLGPASFGTGGTPFTGGFTSSPSGGLANAMFLQGYSDTGASSSNGLMFLRLRMYLANSDTTAGQGSKIAMFLQIGASGNPLITVKPATFSTTGGNARALFNGAVVAANNDKPGRAYTATATAIGNAIDYYQIISASVAWNYTSQFVVTVALSPRSNYVSAAANYPKLFRFGTFNANTGAIYIAPSDSSTLPASAAAPASPTATVTTICTSSGTSPGIRMVPTAANTDLINTNIATGTTFTLSSTASLTKTTDNKLGGFVFCNQGSSTYLWDFRGGSNFAFNTNSFDNSTDKCTAFDFVNDATPALNHVCFYCPTTSTTLGPTATTIGVSNFFTANAVDHINPSWANFFVGDDGSMAEKQLCSTITGLYKPQAATVSSTGSGWTVNGQKVTITATLPTNLTGIVQMQVQGYSYNAAGVASNDITFPQGTLDSSGTVCRIVSTAQISDPTKYETSCSASLTNGLLTFKWTASSSNIVSQQGSTGWTFILWGVNGNTQPGTPAASATYFIQTMRGASIGIVDQSPMTSTGLAVWNYTTGLSNALTTTNIGYQRPILNARGYFRWDFSFPTWKTWFFQDRLTFNVEAVVTGSQNNLPAVVKCRITDTSDNIQQYFRSCTLSSSANTLTIVSLGAPFYMGATATTTVYDFSVTTGLRVYLDNIITVSLQTIKTIYGNLVFSGDNQGSSVSLTKANTATDITALSALSTSQSFPSNPVLTKYWSAANQNTDLVFGMTSAAAINDTCRITIVFPSYYNHNLINKNRVPICTVNNQLTYCYVEFPRALKIEGFPTPIAGGSSFVIRVVGVTAPTTTYTIENFWIQINQDKTENLATITHAGVISDQSSLTVAQPAPIHVNWHSVSTTNTRTTATWQWAFTTLAAQTHDTTKVIQLTFPESWGVAQGFSSPVCSIADWTTSAVYSATQTQIGHVIGLNITTTYNGTAIVLLSCNSIRTPEADVSTYPSQDVQIRLLDATGSSVSYVSAPAVHNVNYNLGFTRATSLTTINWQQTSSLVAPLYITRGTYNVKLTLVLPATRSTKVFQVTPTNNQFGFFPTPVNVTTGLLTLDSLLGCASSVPINYYILTFASSDSVTYTIPQSVAVFVQATRLSFTISPALTTDVTALYSSTTSRTLPVVFDASAALPFSDVTITPNFASGNTNFTVNPSAITLTASTPISWFVYSTTGQTTSVGAVVVTYTLSGTNAAAYGSVVNAGLINQLIVGSQNVKVVADTTSQATLQPTLTIAADSTDTSKATSKVITFTLGQVTSATIYWVAGLSGQIVSDTSTIQSMASSQASYNPMSSNQAQYFITSQTASPKNPAFVTITKLFPNTVYQVNGFANSLTNQNSTVATYVFTTGTNTAPLTRWLYNYTTYPTQAQRQALLCALTSYLAVPQVNVWSINGETCGNTSSFYQGQNSTGDVAVYFYPLQTDTDTVMNNLNTLLNTTAAITAVNTTVSQNGLAGFTNIIPDGNPRNILLTPSWPAATAGLSWLALSGVTLNDTGYVFAVVDTNSSSVPAQAVMKNPTILSNYSFVASQAQFYSASATGPLSFNFTNLSPNTGYNIYLAASNNDPSFLQNFTAVTTVAAKTTAPNTNTNSAFTLASSLLVALISAFALFVF